MYNLYAIHMDFLCIVLPDTKGAVHDACVFRNSPVTDFLTRLEIYFPENSHLIGNAAYGIHLNLTVSYRNT